MALTYNLKPYAISKAITGLGAQSTLTSLLAAVNADLTAQGYTNQCPQCLGNGKVTNELATIVECPTCYGWGKTSEVIGSVRTFTPKEPIPTITL
jgi:DnaJ-class molecular chaperone